MRKILTSAITVIPIFLAVSLPQSGSDLIEPGGNLKNSDFSSLEGIESKVLWSKLRSKRRKLKRLQAEIRTLRNFLMQRDDPDENGGLQEVNTGTWIRNEAETREIPRNDRRKKRKKNRKKKKSNWKRKLLKELRRLNTRLETIGSLDERNLKNSRSRLDQIEVPIRNEREEKGLTKEKRKRRREERRKERREKKKGGLGTGKGKGEAGVIPPDPEAFRKQKLTEITSARHSAQRGESGMSCAFHADCRPGRCCHSGLRNGTICMDHGLQTGSVCADSCQCSSGLHCYQSNEERDEKLLNGRCQVATAEDIKNGIYLNTKNSLFAD